MQTTPWFSVKVCPVRQGIYEICEREGADLSRCFWDGDEWRTTESLLENIAINYWRGLAQRPEFPSKRSAVKPKVLAIKEKESHLASKRDIQRLNLKHNAQLYFGDGV